MLVVIRYITVGSTLGSHLQQFLLSFWRAVHQPPHWFSRVRMKRAYNTVSQKVGANANGLFKHTFEACIQAFNAVVAMIRMCFDYNRSDLTPPGCISFKVTEFHYLSTH